MCQAVGHLTVSEAYHPDFHRYCVTARLVDDAGKLIDGFELFDAVLMSAQPDRWTMRGIERHERWPEDWIDYAQSWVLIPMDELSS